MSKLYEKCLEIATEAHKGQKRWNGKPYITHPLAVAERFGIVEVLPDYEERKCAAILHDVIEDTAITAEELLKQGVPKKVVEIVVVLTRAKEEPYEDYIYRVGRNLHALQIKIEDLKHNLSDLKPGNLKTKYELALMYLDERFEQW